jgi:hypothetical protein
MPPKDPNWNRGGQFKPGQSGNPYGKARKLKTLISMALAEKMASVDPEVIGVRQTCAERIADIMYTCVIHPDPEVDKTRLMAISEIIDRVEGKAKQQIDLNDVTEDLRSRSDEDLAYYMQHAHWPEDKVQ